MFMALLWRHNGRDGVSNHQPHDCLLNRLFRCRSKKTPKLCVTGFCWENSPVTGELPAQMVSNAEKFPFDFVFMGWTSLPIFSPVAITNETTILLENHQFALSRFPTYFSTQIAFFILRTLHWHITSMLSWLCNLIPMPMPYERLICHRPTDSTYELGKYKIMQKWHVSRKLLHSHWRINSLVLS